MIKRNIFTLCLRKEKQDTEIPQRELKGRKNDEHVMGKMMINSQHKLEEVSDRALKMTLLLSATQQPQLEEYGLNI